MSMRGQQIIHELMGTCKNLNDVLTEDEEEDRTLLDEINDAIMCCEGCGWWCEVEEIDGEGYCFGCLEPGED